MPAKLRCARQYSVRPARRYASVSIRSSGVEFLPSSFSYTRSVRAVVDPSRLIHSQPYSLINTGAAVGWAAFAVFAPVERSSSVIENTGLSLSQFRENRYG